MAHLRAGVARAHADQWTGGTAERRKRQICELRQVAVRIDAHALDVLRDGERRAPAMRVNQRGGRADPVLRRGSLKPVLFVFGSEELVHFFEVSGVRCQ